MMFHLVWDTKLYSVCDSLGISAFYNLFCPFLSLVNLWVQIRLTSQKSLSVFFCQKYFFTILKKMMLASFSGTRLISQELCCQNATLCKKNDFISDDDATYVQEYSNSGRRGRRLCHQNGRSKVRISPGCKVLGLSKFQRCSL
jgi:hypothetical protein